MTSHLSGLLARLFLACVIALDLWLCLLVLDRALRLSLDVLAMGVALVLAWGESFSVAGNVSGSS